jgi:outer membrane lipoprotein SlyB
MRPAYSAAAALALSLLASPGSAEAKGCIKGAIVGGAAGHLAHHGVLGAIGGCVVGHHMASEKEKRNAAESHNKGASPAEQNNY